MPTPPARNGAIILRSYPVHFTLAQDDVEYLQGQINLTSAGARLKHGEVLVKLLYLSVDPYLRFRLVKPNHKEPELAYLDAFALTKPITSHGVVRVIKSKNPKFSPGDILTSLEGDVRWENYSILKAQEAGLFSVQKNETRLPLSYFVGPLGLAGLTAYAGLVEIGKAIQGETVLVAGGSGAVGQLAIQIAKLKGLRVIAASRGEEKCQFLKSLGADVVLDTSQEGAWRKLEKCKPLNILFDNLGGEVIDRFIDVAARHSRIVLCGASSQYALGPHAYGIKNLAKCPAKRITLQGYIATDASQKTQAAFIEEMQHWLSKGQITLKEQFAQGLEQAPQLLNDCIAGKTSGKAIVVVEEADPM